MNLASWGAHGLAYCQIACLGSDRVSKGSRQDVHAFLVVGVAVWRRNVRARRHGQFKHSETLRVGAIDEVVDTKLANPDFGSAHWIPLSVADSCETCVTLLLIRRANNACALLASNLPSNRSNRWVRQTITE